MTPSANPSAAQSGAELSSGAAGSEWLSDPDDDGSEGCSSAWEDGAEALAAALGLRAGRGAGRQGQGEKQGQKQKFGVHGTPSSLEAKI